MRKAEEILADQLRDGAIKRDLARGVRSSVGTSSALRAIQQAQREAIEEAANAADAVGRRDYFEHGKVIRAATSETAKAIRALLPHKE